MSALLAGLAAYFIWKTPVVGDILQQAAWESTKYVARAGIRAAIVVKDTTLDGIQALTAAATERLPPRT